MDDLLIPPEFFQSLSDAEMRAVIERSYLDRKQCRKLWRMTDRQGKPPHRLIVEIEWSSLLRSLNDKLGPPPLVRGK